MSDGLNLNSRSNSNSNDYGTYSNIVPMGLNSRSNSSSNIIVIQTSSLSEVHRLQVFITYHR